MKRIAKILLITLIAVLMLTVSTYAFTIEPSVDVASVKVGEEVVYTIKLDEKVVATNFNLSYSAEALELVGPVTSGLNVAVKDGKVAAIYADLSGVGTDKLQIKFKAKAKIDKMEFAIEDAKFRGVNKDVSYVGETITGLGDKVEIKVTSTTTGGKDDGTTSGGKLPNTGVGIGLTAVIVVIILGMIKSGSKVKKMKDIAPVMLAVVVAGTMFGTSVKAIDYEPVRIILDITDLDRQITMAEYVAQNLDISQILNENGQAIQSTDIIKNGYSVVKTDGTTSIIILYGDANGDGTICDTDDIMIIIDTYLGNINPSNLQFAAANLANEDGTLDVDDIMQMMNMYLGRLQENLLTNPIENGQQGGNGEEEPTPTPGEEQNENQKLVDVAQFGDLVNYPVGNGLNWRVWKNDGTNVMIMPENPDAQFLYSQEMKQIAACLKEINKNSNLDDWCDAAASTALNKIKTYINETYAEKVVYPLRSDFDSYKNSGNTQFNSYFNNAEYYIFNVYGNSAGAESSTTGVIPANGKTYFRPVVVLKGDTRTTGKDGNGWSLTTEINSNNNGNNSNAQGTKECRVVFRGFNATTQQPLMGIGGGHTINGENQILQVYDSNCLDFKLTNVEANSTIQEEFTVENKRIVLAVVFDANKNITNVSVVSSECHNSIDSYINNEINSEININLYI